MSLGRYGADVPADRKVPLNITVDRWISEALGKIRTKKSVSDLVNGLLATVVSQFDPGPSAPMVHELVRVIVRHKKDAEDSGDRERAALADLMLSKLDPYIDLAEARSELRAPTSGPNHGAAPRQETSGRISGGQDERRSPLPPPRKGDGFKHDYWWYAVPVICHGKPMAFLNEAMAWKCTVCGRLIHDT